MSARMDREAVMTPCPDGCVVQPGQYRIIDFGTRDWCSEDKVVVNQTYQEMQCPLCQRTEKYLLYAKET